MQMRRMFAVGFCRRVAENSSRIGRFMGKAERNQPIENAANRYPVDVRLCFVGKAALNFRMAERSACTLQPNNEA